jgi:cystathionine gamma-lyase
VGSNNSGFSSRAIHTGETPNLSEGGSGDVVIPIHLSTTFARKKINEPTAGYEYSRSGNPTRDALEKKLASLENATYGFAFSSGLAAQSTVLLSLLKPGDEVIAGDDLYGGSKRVFNKFLNNFLIKTLFFEIEKPETILELINNNTKVIWIESLSNPLLKVADIKKIAAIAQKNNLLLIVDNTFLTPYFHNPLNFGADIVIHSATKYLGGHSDVISGVAMLNDSYLADKIKFHQNALGTITSPFDSYLLLRGIKTLSARLRIHQENALRIAQFLEGHSKIKKVIYPGLESHSENNLLKSIATGFGGMITFELTGNKEQAVSFVENLHFFHLAESLGGVESLIELPSVMTHASIDKDTREKIGITDTLIRASVGIEDIEDLIDDLREGLEKI